MRLDHVASRIVNGESQRHVTGCKGGQRAIPAALPVILAPVYGRAYSWSATPLFLAHKIKMLDRAAQTDDKDGSEHPLIPGQVVDGNADRVCFAIPRPAERQHIAE